MTYPSYVATKGRLRVELTYIGEGYNGDYDPDDPEDAPLYRVDITRRGVDYETDGGSWCTCIVANDPNSDYKAIAKRIVEYAHMRRTTGPCTLDHIAQSVSWFSNNNLTDHMGRTA
jgi:hypothetical protein